MINDEELSLETVEKDFADSQRDLEALKKLVDGMRAFIANPCGEDRSSYKADLFKWEQMQAFGEFLHSKIEEKLKQLREPPTPSSPKS